MAKKDMDIAKVEHYVDSQARQVAVFKPLDAKRATTMRGHAEIRLANGRAMNFEFRFPDSVKTVRQAFQKFDEVCRAEFDKMAEQQREQQKGQIILPGAISPDQIKRLKGEGGEGG